MNLLNVVSRALYGKKRWKKTTNLFFAQQDNFAPIGISEFPKAIMATVVGFLPVDNKVVPVALQGLLAGQNWFVDWSGKWQGEYLPAKYSCYPFRLLKTENGDLILGVDEASGLITEELAAEGELFFDAENNPSELIIKILSDLNKIEQDYENAQAVCSLLQKYDLFEPWPIQLKGTEGTKSVEGLYRINEIRLNALPAESLRDLRDNNGLLLIYGQLFSMQNVPKLGKLAFQYNEARNRSQALAQGVGLLGDSGSISFDNL